MRKNHARVILSIVFTALTCYALQPQAQNSSSTRGLTRHSHGQLPFLFEANQGQADPRVKFLSKGNGYSAFLTAGGMVLALRPSKVTSSTETPALPTIVGPGRGRSVMRQLESGAREQKSAATFAIDLVGANANPQAVGEEPLPTKVNYFIGRDRKKWRTNVPTYAKVRYRNVYPGVDLVYYGNNRSMESDFDLAPGADAKQIQFAVKGADSLNVDTDGNLVLTKASTRLRFQTPILYQTVNGMRTRVPGSYVLRDGTHVGFNVGVYDTTKPLVIDPVLVYSTYLGGSSDDFTDAIRIDPSGNAYVAGITDSPDFPLAGLGSYSSTQFRMFLTKLDSTGSTLLFADYFGGTSGNDGATSLALDSSGNAYVTGNAMSSDFPAVNAYQSNLSGTQDAFLVKFSADGSSIVYSTYLGGSNSQFANSVSVDPAGEAVIAGITQSTDFPTRNAYQSSVSTDQFGDWGVYGFLSKFAADGTSLVYSTYLAGANLNTSSCTRCFPDSEIMSVVTDASGNAYVAGNTTTTDFPVTSGAFIGAYPGYYLSDVGFVSKFTTSGSIAYSTYLGGLTSSFLNAIAVDANGSAYVTGYDTADDGFPIVTTNMCDPSVAACNGTIIAKLDPTGSSLIYSTFLGTSNNMAGQAIQVDANGDAFIVGSDVQFDLSNPIEGYAGNGDVVVAEIDPGATTLLMATFLGGRGWEAAADLALDSNGAVFVTGVTQSPDFPVTQAALQTVPGGQTDVFITKIDPTTNAPSVAMAPSSLQFPSQDIGSTSTSQLTVLRNMGSAALAISSKTVGADFAETDDCGTTVQAASFCTFTVTFTPTASGTLAEALITVDSAVASPHVVTLTGTGAGDPSSFSTSPTSLSFSSSPLGAASAAQNIAIANTGNATLSIRGVQVTGDFSVVGNDCGSIVANGTCSIHVTFTPTTAGSRDGTLRLTDSATGSQQMVALSGSGVDFTTSPVNNSASMKAGGSATYQLRVGPDGGSFSNPVSFACTGAPASATCTLTPQSIIPHGTSSTVTVTVQTTGAVGTMPPPPGRRNCFLASWIFATMGLFGVILLGHNDRRKKIAQRTVLALAMITFLVSTGCGTTRGGGQRSPAVAQSTPPGNYTLTVVGTSGKTHHSVSLALTVE